MRSTHTIDREEIQSAIHRYFEWRLGRDVDPSEIALEGVGQGLVATLDVTDEDRPVPPGTPDIRTPIADYKVDIEDRAYWVHYVANRPTAFIVPIEDPTKAYKVARTFSPRSIQDGEFVVFDGYECTCPDFQHRRTYDARDRDGTPLETANTPCKHLRALRENPELPGLPGSYNVGRSPIADPVPEVASNAFDVSMGATWTEGHQ